MSGSGILFTTDCFLAEGSRIELAVNWPVSLDGVALKLVVMGRVVWAEDERAAVAIKQYVFKTRKSQKPLSTTPKPLSQYRPNEAKVTRTTASNMVGFS